MNLSHQPPRRPSNLSIAGILSLARLADKARAHNEETLHNYVYGNNSGLDKCLLEFLNLSEDTFADAADRYNDADLGDWVLKTSGKTESEINAFNQHHLQRELEDDAARARLKARVEKFAPGNTDIKTIIQSIELDDWGTFRHTDLTVRAPRTPYSRNIADLYAVARLADKARADKAGKLNDYIYNCPIDQAVLAFTNLSADAFQDAAYHNPNDLELTDWMLKNTTCNQAEISTFNAQIAQRGPETDEQKEFFQTALNRIAPHRTDITTWFDLLDLDDEHSYNTVDLTRHAPRSPYDTSVGGIMSFARMIDKGRASISDTIGDYWFGNDSGIDRHVLEFLDISEDDFKTVLQNHPTDADVLHGTTISKSQDEIQAFNDHISQLGPPKERQAWFEGVIAKLDPSRTDIQTFFAMMQLEDRVIFVRLKAGV